MEFPEDESSLPKAGADGLHQTAPAGSPPDIKCPTCLKRFDNMFCLNLCLQKSRFSSVQEWSEAKAECLLCKLPCQSAFHGAGAEEDSKYVSWPSENCALSKADLWGFPYPTSRETDTVVSPCSSSTSQQTDDITSNVGFLDQSVLLGDHRVNEAMGLFAIRRLISADRTYLGPYREESTFDFIPVLQRFGVQDLGDNPHRDISARSQIPTLMNMIVVLLSSGVLLFVCFYLYLSVILLHK